MFTNKTIIMIGQDLKKETEEINKGLNFIDKALMILGIIAAIIVCVFICLIVYINAPYNHQKKTLNRKTHHKGSISYEIPADTIYYDQHPQKKCWHSQWENR